jgi:hypothetical protein
MPPGSVLASRGAAIERTLRQAEPGATVRLLVDTYALSRWPTPR